MARLQTMFLLADFVFSLISVILAHRSNCRVEEYRVQKQFDPQKFAGRWYAYKYLPNSRYPSPLPFQDLVLTFIPVDNRSYTTYTTSRENSWSNCTTLEGTMKIPFAGSNQSAKMEFQPDISSNETLTFWVLETDYTIFAVVYGCLTELNATTGFCPENEVNGWALVRFAWEPLSAYKDWRVDHRLDYFCSNISHYERVVHNKHRCRFPESMFWLPQPAFNLTLFMGTWYEQEVIPMDTKTLPRAETDQNVLLSLMLRQDGIISCSRSARRWTDRSVCVNSTLYLEATTTPGKFNLKNDTSSEGIDFTVVFTDYTSFVFALGCLDETPNPDLPCVKYHSWVGSRYANTSGHSGLWLQRLMALHDIDDRLYYPTIQNNTCGYVPPSAPAPTTPAPAADCPQRATGGAPRDMHETFLLITASMMTLVWKAM